MYCHVSSMERFWASRSQCLILAKVCSIGLRSGEEAAGTRAWRRLL